jgi:hypothetical protein
MLVCRACYRGITCPLEDFMIVRVALACLIVAVPLAAQPFDGLRAAPSNVEGQQEERPKVPKDSLLVTVTGCLKGRVIRASDVKQPDTTSGIVIRNHSFRLAGKKDVMKAVKEEDGHRVEITGLIKKSALIEPGIKFKGGRVIIGGGTSGGATSSMPDPAENVVVLDAETVQAIGGSCGGS